MDYFIIGQLDAQTIGELRFFHYDLLDAASFSLSLHTALNGVGFSSGTARAVRCRFEKNCETPGGMRRSANKMLHSPIP